MSEITLPHSVTYVIDKDVPVSMVASSLLANAALIRDTIKVIESLYDGLQINITSIRVSEVTSGSPLSEKFLIAIFVVYQNELEREIPALVTKLTGREMPSQYDTLITVGVLLVASEVISRVVERFFKNKKKDKLEKENKKLKKRLAHILGEKEGALSERIKKAIDERYTNELVKNSYDFYAPARLDDRGCIRGMGDLEVDASTLSEIPSDVELVIDRKIISEGIPNVEVQVRAADHDYQSRGWAAVVSEVSPKRLRMELAPDIEASRMFGVSKIVGDVLVVKEKQPTGEFVPRNYVLTKVRSSSSAQSSHDTRNRPRGRR